MDTYLLKTIKIILLFALLSTLQAKDTIVFAPLPMENIKTVFTQFNPMIDYLSKKLNKKIILDYNTNYADILKKFKQGKIDIAYLGPLPYVALKKEYPLASPLVHFKNSEGHTFYTCSIITFATTSTRINNIVNKKIALTQPLSTCGYLSVNALLNKSDNSLENNKYRYLNRHDSVALSVIKGEFDFGGVKNSIAKKYSNLGLKVISSTPLLPSFVLVGNEGTLSKKTLDNIQNIMTNVERDEYQLWGKNISYGCSKSKDTDYNGVRKLKKSMNIPSKGNF